MINKKTPCKILQSVTFLLCKFIETVLVTFLAIIFVVFVDIVSITVIISSYTITEVSAILFKYLQF